MQFFHFLKCSQLFSKVNIEFNCFGKFISSYICNIVIKNYFHVSYTSMMKHESNLKKKIAKN